jgi:hypothetical protein
MERQLKQISCQFLKRPKRMRDMLSGHPIQGQVLVPNICWEQRPSNKSHNRSVNELHLFAGDIGGSMGLFVGGSVLSVFELLDVFLYNGLVHAKSSKKRRRQQQQQQLQQQ